MEWGYTLAGLFVGIMIGMTGVGGGSLMTPILIFVFAVQPAIAVGTDLLFAAITKAGGVWAYWRHGVVDWTVVKRLAMGSISTTVLTLWILSTTGVENGQHADLITSALGVALILTSSALLLKGFIGGLLQARAGHPIVSALYRVRQDEQHKAVATVATGAFLGVMVTLSSVGAGALGAVALLFLYPHMKGVEIVATDIAHAVPLTAIAGLGHATVGTVDWSLLSFLVMGSLPGIYIGSHLGVKISDKVMRHLLAVLLLLVGIKCLL
ncbi:MAG: hypothetical protein COB23_02220 [Methylophaga sp.]|nr:MAG: hypothetical protein COB23_02220 [Methylophaga sp.]